MKLQFLGANRQVTGSKYLLDLGHARLLIDCGMFQERRFEHRNWDPFPIDVGSIDAVLLTHAHLDHCGLLPRLYAHGCTAPILATAPTIDLTDLTLRDAAQIQVEDVKYKQKRHAVEGRKSPHPYVPLYDLKDAEAALGHLQSIPYFTQQDVVDGVSAIYHDAGHILGSANIELICQVDHRSEPFRIVFSGDIGQGGRPILRDPSVIRYADYVIVESTYGDRLHEATEDVDTQLESAVNESIARGGKILIPTFAIERAQELMYHFAKLSREGRLPAVPVFLDSPMAVDATEIFKKHRSVYDADMWNTISSGFKPLGFPNLVIARSQDESKAINRVPGPAIIMASSGMCTGGRIKFHLRQHLGDPNATVLFVGFQSEGTLGRAILNGNPMVRIHGQSYSVAAQIKRIFGFSGHADRHGLIDWCRGFHQQPKQAFITHGDESAATSLAQGLREIGWSTMVPDYQETVTLT